MEKPKRNASKPVRFSPSPQTSRKRARVLRYESDVGLTGDILSDGSVFLCDKCGSNVFNNRLRGKVKRRNRIVEPTIRQSSSGQRLKLCFTCGLKIDNAHSQFQSNHSNSKPATCYTLLQKDEFSKELVRRTSNPRAAELICRNPKLSCNCSFDWLISSNDVCCKTITLLGIVDKAMVLRQQKLNEKMTHNGVVGLGNGKKRSKQYESFVLSQRKYLREELGFCESVAQKILGYSNNFLHKRLLTEKMRNRLGKHLKRSLLPVTCLWSKECCKDSCVRMARSHVNLIAKWRQLASESQRGLQQAVAELLTPAAGGKKNCYNFVKLVTGCSTATVAKISKKLEKNGGVLGIQEHGLRKYWRSKRHESGDVSIEYDGGMTSVWSLPIHNAEEVELHQTVMKQSQQLEQLQAQIEKQQIEIEKHKSMLSSWQLSQQRRETIQDNLQYPLLSKRSLNNKMCPQPANQSSTASIWNESVVIATSKQSNPMLNASNLLHEAQELRDSSNIQTHQWYRIADSHMSAGYQPPSISALHSGTKVPYGLAQTLDQISNWSVSKAPAIGHFQ